MKPDLKKIMDNFKKRLERRELQKYNSRKERRLREIRKHHIELIAREIHTISEIEKPKQLCFGY